MIDALIAELAAADVASDACNQYANNGSAANTLRRHNLRLYLHQVLTLGPQLVLVAEAPGYRGCRRTGVPFTSDRILLNGVDPPGLFGVAHGYAAAQDDATHEQPARWPAEQTATIIWRELQRHNLMALGWNAWPFHPHRVDNPQSNRPPRAPELRQGLAFLQMVLALTPAIPVVAVGKCAEHSLNALGVACYTVRHPAQGGATRFAHGLQQIASHLHQM